MRKFNSNVHDPAFRLKAIRKSSGSSQYEFARSLNVSLRSYQYYESGARSLPGELLHRLAELGINVHWIVTGDGESNVPPHEEIAKLSATADYWQANYLKVDAKLKLVRLQVGDKSGGKSLEQIPDQPAPSLEEKVKEPLPASKSTTVTEKEKKRK